MICLTPAAARAINDSRNQIEDEGVCLRVAARLGDDGEIEYGMGFDEEREQDMVFEDRGVAILVGPPSAPFLDGTTIDFVAYDSGHYRFIFIPAPPAEVEARCGSGGCDRCRG